MFPILDSSGLTVIEIASSGSLMSMLKIHLKEVSELRVQHSVITKLKKALLQFYIKPSLLSQVCLSSEYTKVFGRTLKGQK